jgi:hypothetical protein
MDGIRRGGKWQPTRRRHGSGEKGGFMKRSFLFLGVLCLLVISYSGAWATSYSGSIQTSDGTLIGSASWPNNTGSKLSWVVDDFSDPGFWTYAYQFDVNGSKISNVIIEVSSAFTFLDIDQTYPADYTLDTFYPVDYQGLPSSIFGVKWGAAEQSFSWGISTAATPMWGEFYGKGDADGNGKNYAYNSEFGTDTLAPISDGNAGGWVLVPNSVPESSTMLLLGFGLMGMAFIGRRKIFR